MGLSQETKVGLFLITGVAVIILSILFLGKINLFQRNNIYYSEFTNVEALPPKAAVKIAGVEIGKVGKVRLINGLARVTLKINRGIDLYSNATVRIGSTGIIGTRFVEINPGTPDTPRLEEGAVIPGINGTSIESMMSKISTLFDEDPRYGNIMDNLKASMAHIERVTGSLDVAMGGRGKDIESIVNDIRDFAQSAKEVAKNLEEVSTEKKEDLKIAIEKFRGVGEKLDAILAKIQSGEGTIGALVSDKKTEAEVRETISSIKETAFSAKRTLGRVGRINGYWDYRYRYDFRDDANRSDLAIKLVPRPGKFYALGVTNIGEYVPKSQTFERKDAWTAVMGADLGPFTGYAGAIRSAGGLGLNFRPLWFNKKLDRRLEITAEGYESTRDRIVKGTHVKGTILDVGVHAAITRWWWVGVRQQDILERSAFQVYSNIIFRDEDLGALLGLAAIAR